MPGSVDPDPADDGQLGAGLITGIHDIRIPVTDPWVSRGWYMSFLGLDSVLDLQEAEGLIGVVLRHPAGFVVGLHRDPARARALRGFVVLALEVPDRPGLEAAAESFDRLGVPHSPPGEGHLGWYFDVPDPDGIVVRFHTATPFDVEEA